MAISTGVLIAIWFLAYGILTLMPANYGGRVLAVLAIIIGILLLVPLR